MKVKALTAAVLLAFSGGALSQERNNIADLIYYEIGGESRIPARENGYVPLRAAINWETPSCNGFDPALSISNILNGVTGALEDIGDTLVNTASGAISNWPMMAIARADPELYEMIKQGQIKAEELFQMSVSSCEAISDDVIAGEGGVEDWVKYSGFEKWSKESEETTGKDIVQTDEDIKDDMGNDGTEMPTGTKGGEGQEPIDMIKEGVFAGSNALSGREADNSSNFPEGQDEPWFAEHWDSPEEMEDWVKEIIGEVEIRTCEGCEKLNSTPGKGVYPILQKEQEEIARRLTELVEGIGPENDIYDSENLEDVSAPGFQIGPSVIAALKQEQLYRGAFISALAEEIALARTTERMLSVRRVLIASKRNAILGKNPQAIKRLEALTGELTGEMQLLSEEFEFREKVRSSAATRLLQRARAEREMKLPQRQESGISEMDRLEEIIE